MSEACGNCVVFFAHSMALKRVVQCASCRKKEKERKLEEQLFPKVPRDKRAES